MKKLYRVLISINATTLMFLMYLIKEKCWIAELGSCSIFIYSIILLLFTKVCLALRVILKKDSIQSEITEVSITTDGYMAVFLGYIFVALGISSGDWQTLMFVFLIVNIFTYNSQTIYFNPLFCLFGYNFYEIHTKMGTKLYVISRKKNIKGTRGLEFKQLRRINEFTYIDEEK